MEKHQTSDILVIFLSSNAKEFQFHLNRDNKRVTSAIADVMISGIGCVVSPIPSRINLASGCFRICSDSRIDIWLRNQETVSMG